MSSIEKLITLCLYFYRLFLDTKCFDSYCWYCQDKCLLCLKPSGPDYSALDSCGKTLRYCTPACRNKLNDISQLNYSVSQVVTKATTAKIVDIVKVQVEGSGLIEHDQYRTTVHTALYIFLVRVKEEEALKFPMYSFYHSRSHHMQIFYECDSIPAILDLLEFTKTTCDLDRIVYSAVHSFQGGQVLSTGDFYSELIKQCNAPDSSPINSGNAAYSLPVPLLNIRILDVDNNSTSSRKQDGTATEIPKVTQITAIVTEKEFSKIILVAPPDTATMVEFTSGSKGVNFHCKDLKIIYCDGLWSLPVCFALLDKINIVMTSPLEENNKSNECIYESLVQLYTKVELCLADFPTKSKQVIGDYAKDMIFINNLRKLTSFLYVGKSSSQEKE